jgi:extracellular elastinolytic metalloproteinase
MALLSSGSPRRAAFAASAAVTLAVAFGAATIPASAAPRASRAGGDTAHRTTVTPDKGFYDVRAGGSTADKVALQQQAATASSRKATQRLRASLGQQAVVDMDGLTGTPRMIARLDGYLTGPSHASAAAITLRYVRSHLAALGLTRSDLATFYPTRQWTDISGIRHVSWTQWAGGYELFGNGLQANVTRNGRLLSLSGSPVHGLTAPTVSTPKVGSAGKAIAVARSDVGESVKAGPGDTAHQMLFFTPEGVRLGWLSVTMSSTRPTDTFVDAATGQVLYRRDLAANEVAPIHTKVAGGSSTGLAYLYFPKAPTGGKAQDFNFTKKGWLSANTTILFGNNSHAYSDVNDDNKPNKSEEVHPTSGHAWNYRLQPFHLKGHGYAQFCDAPYPCSWNPNKPFSWKVNRAQNATQVFFFVNNFHDHLLRAPIGFTEAAGNFQRINSTGRGAGHDPVQTQTDDGANTGKGPLRGLPDENHIDNANMATPVDGRAPRMQMYLQHAPFTSYPSGDPFAPTNVGDEADTVYHEYTHGLSDRLVVNVNGHSTLGAVQAGAMGEAWSDWYAMDYLVARGLQADVKGTADVVLFQYDGDGVFFDRTEPIDCKVGDTSTRCTGGATGHTGGYTYADYGKVFGSPEVHSDGEIWAQTLWDLRDKLGSKRTESLVTRAMSLSPSNPSFVDERNAILLADLATTGGDDQTKIWQVFAHRGLGYFAGALSGGDPTPGASFQTPPTTGATGSLSGTVTDSLSGDPIEGATVTVAFGGSPFAVNPTVTTAADGTYTMFPIPQGTYPKVTITAPGYDPQSFSLDLNQMTATKNAALERDWAAASGGATIDSSTGQSFAGCRPKQAIDQSVATGWESTSDLVNGAPGPDTAKDIVIKLPQPVDLDHLTLNPQAVCGDGTSASMGSYTIETSSDGTTYTSIASGTFVAADMGQTNTVPVSGPGTTSVQYVKVWNNAPLVTVDNSPGTGSYPSDACSANPGGYSGCTYLDLGEAGVYGVASP